MEDGDGYAQAELSPSLGNPTKSPGPIHSVQENELQESAKAGF